MARNFVTPNVGSSGRRRIVPIMGIDFIAGQIERKGGPIVSRLNERRPYGVKGASIGGRTRFWSFINFLNVRASSERSTPVSADETLARQNFATARKSALATLQNLAVITQINTDFKEGTVRANTNPDNYATKQGWVMAVRLSQIASGTDIQDTTNTWF